MKSHSNLRWLWFSLLILIIDLLTKKIAQQHLFLYQPIAVLPFFNLTLAHNTGAAFSLLSQAGKWHHWFFIFLALGASVLIIAWLAKLPKNQNWTACAIALILAGALGNVYDRLTLGYVVDFLDFYYQHWHWPIFNIADCAVCVGAAMLLIELVRGK